MRRLLLIKHSAPEIVPSQPARLWTLSATGRARCSALARHLGAYAPATIVASTEPKAAETAQLISEALRKSWYSVEGLHEHDRSNVPFLSSAEFEATMARFFAEPDRLVFGRETADAARDRFSRAIMEVLQRHPQDDLAVVAHGTVITLFVAQTNSIDPFKFWQRLGLPSYVVLLLPDLSIIRVTEQIE
ncbi:MAG TPA: histidine phosphatase family protein [Herpetosiphonaceae bacterium]|jgi:broad specificity phosphatase PhoE|nr:histidine phosphatase family protein [Herpetosiphonaceae bacterium]